MGVDLVEDVAALYIDPRGPYPGLVRHWYDEERNAEMYAGPWPVVAHPPCGPWGGLRHLNRTQAPEHAPHALAIVREFGGVLEHPADSKLWDACGLPLPAITYIGRGGDITGYQNGPGPRLDDFGGYTIELDQCEWGHCARKRTW